MKPLDLIGQRFGRLTVVGRDAKVGGDGVRYVVWICKCDCGGDARVMTGPIRKKNGTRSCGCLQKERTAEAKRTHCGTGTAEFRVWMHMRERCRNPNDKAFRNYGGRGICVCERWSDFANFLADMGKRPSPKHSIERLDVDGHYEPGNCTWATKSQQARNTRSTTYLTIDGVTRRLVEWADEYNIPASEVHKRIYRGWNEADAVKRPRRLRR